MRRAQITLRLMIAATLGWGLLWAVAAPAMAQSTPDPDLATVTVYKLFCQDDERAGETEFQIETVPDDLDDEIVDECTATVDDDAEEPTFTLTNVQDDQGESVQADEGIVEFTDVLLGTYTLTEEPDESEEPEPGELAPSVEFTLAEGDPLDLDITVINFVAGPPATVQVDKVFCVDGDREGEVDFFVQVDDDEFSAEAVAADCQPADEGEARFTLSQSEEEESLGPEETDADGTAEFEDVPPGTYVLTEVESEAASDPFEVANGEERPTTRVVVINYVAPEPTNTPTNTPPSGGGETPDPTATRVPTDRPDPTNTPTSGGGVVNPPVVTQRTPIVTTPSRPVTTNRNCANLTTVQAQALLDADPSDPNNLDTDDDGIACEDGVSTTTTGGTVRTAPVVRSSPVSVTALPSTGEGTANGAPLGEFAFWLVAALAVIALGATMVRRRTG